MTAGSKGFKTRVEAETFAGMKAGADVSVDVAGVKPQAGAEGQFGIGATAGVDLGFHDGKLKLGVSLGVAFGPGLKLTSGMEVDVGKLADGAGDAAKAVGSAPGKAVEAVNGLL